MDLNAFDRLCRIKDGESQRAPQEQHTEESPRKEQKSTSMEEESLPKEKESTDKEGKCEQTTKTENEDGFEIIENVQQSVRQRDPKDDPKPTQAGDRALELKLQEDLYRAIHQDRVEDYEPDSLRLDECDKKLDELGRVMEKRARRVHASIISGKDSGEKDAK